MAATPSSHRPVSWTCRFLVWHAHDKPVPRGMKVTGDWYTLLSTSGFCPGSLVQSYSLGTDRRAVQFSLWFNNPSHSSPSTLLIHTSLTPSLSLLPFFRPSSLLSPASSTLFGLTTSGNVLRLSPVFPPSYYCCPSCGCSPSRLPNLTSGAHRRIGEGKPREEGVEGWMSTRMPERT